MGILIKYEPKHILTESNLASIICEIKNKLAKRAKKAFLFGSVPQKKYKPTSDIDILIVVEEAKKPFAQRGQDFLDLYDVYPNIDFLVYTEEELKNKLEDHTPGFWSSVRDSMQQII